MRYPASEKLEIIRLMVTMSEKSFVPQAAKSVS
jgi:hypothetical protein